MPLLTCPSCGKRYEKPIAYINQAEKKGLKLFCSQACFGISRRKNNTIEQKKIDKAEYDKQYRYYHREDIKEKKAAAFQKDYAANPEKYKKQRQQRYSRHLQYLQTEKYKQWKKGYDLKYRANKYYGEYGEAAVLLFELEEFLDKNMPAELKFQMGITNKKQKRSRLWQRTNKNYQQQT